MTGNIDIPAVGEETLLDYIEIIMSVVPVADVLGRVAVDSEVTVRGWCVPAEILKLAFLSSPSMTVPALILYRPLLIILCPIQSGSAASDHRLLGDCHR